LFDQEHPAITLTISSLLTIVKQPTFTHLPGQWLDVHVPFIPQAGGFTITSAPLHAEKGHNGRKYLELAIQKSPYNPPAAFFWQPKDKILGTPLQVRVGGRFVYPPPYLSEKEALDIKRIVFVAGGVGINPIMSMLEHLDLESHLDPARIRSLRLLYGTREKPVESILFYERIARILGKHLKSEPAVAGADHDYRATMYLTGGAKESIDEASRHKMLESEPTEHKYRRVNHTDLIEALGPVAGRKDTVAYVCGPPRMTDECVEILSRADGMDPRRVLCEKWW
jgi:NAD(P)H-flavin reductase